MELILMLMWLTFTQQQTNKVEETVVTYEIDYEPEVTAIMLDYSRVCEYFAYTNAVWQLKYGPTILKACDMDGYFVIWTVSSRDLTLRITWFETYDEAVMFKHNHIE